MSSVLQPRTTPCDAPGLGSCAFARRYLRNHWFVFSSSGYLDVSVPRVRPWLGQVPGSRPAGCPIRKSAHQRVFAPTRGLSQLVTSFVASESLGILHAPFSPFLVILFRRIPLAGYRGRPRFLQLPAICPHGRGGCEIALFCSVLLLSFARCHLYSYRRHRFHHVNVLLSSVVPGRVELPTSTLSV